MVNICIYKYTYYIKTIFFDLFFVYLILIKYIKCETKINLAFSCYSINSTSTNLR